MKLRTTHNSIRIRIRKSELSSLQLNKAIEESIRFPNGVLFKFALLIDDTVEKLDAIFENNKLILIISKSEANNWMKTNQVGIENHINLSDGEQLHVLIEKDFPCLDRAEEDKSDTFWELAPESPESC